MSETRVDRHGTQHLGVSSQDRDSYCRTIARWIELLGSFVDVLEKLDRLQPAASIASSNQTGHGPEEGARALCLLEGCRALCVTIEKDCGRCPMGSCIIPEFDAVLKRIRKIASTRFERREFVTPRIAHRIAILFATAPSLDIVPAFR